MTSRCRYASTASGGTCPTIPQPRRLSLSPAAARTPPGTTGDRHHSWPPSSTGTPAGCRPPTRPSTGRNQRCHRHERAMSGGTRDPATTTVQLAEQALLGALLWDPSRVREVMEWLTPDDF